MIISKKIKYFLAICGFIVIGGTLQAQDFIMNSSPVNSCSGNFFDSGGSFNRYSDNENIIKTICPAGGSGTHIELQFLTTDIGSGDNLCIYDGNSVAAPQILCTINDQSDQANGAFKVAASAPNNSGCLTMQFTSDGAGRGQGWEAIIDCVPAHQRVIAELESTNPPVVPQDNGWIDICPGESVNFVARGIYPQNGFNYFQSDASSVFSWDFGDGTIGFGKNVTHTYQRSGGYTVQVIIEDNQGCTNNNVISQRVRVATKPSFTFDGDFPDTVCANDTLLFLNNINNGDSFIGVIPNEGKFEVTSGVVDSIPLPDGVNVAYESPVTFSEYIPGALITNVNQVESICINIEHSYVRDLDISIQCPDGQIMRLDTTNVQFTLEAYLGIPYEDDDNIPGNTDDPIPGTGFTYCFTPTPQYGSFYDQALSQPQQTSLPEGTYRPIDSFNTLLGCSVNGEWKLIVEDKIKQDNGWLFSWSITFAEELRPEIETFTPTITDWGWVDNETIIFNDQDSMLSVPGAAGTINYIFQVTDDYGCTFDTTIAYSVLSPTDPQCFFCEDIVGDAPDEGICEGEDVQLEVEYLGFNENTIPFENNTPTEFGNATHPPSSPLESEIAVAGASPATITNTNTDIASVCMDIDTDATGDLQIYLTAPTGEVLELTTNNGGTGDNFRNTCFKPNAALPRITNGSAPFAGDYRPEGNWSSLLGAQINGKWMLSLSDAFGPLDKNSLNSWSISFNVENEITYGWSPTLGLSCTNCPNPIASPAATTEYIATINDSFGCTGFDTIVVSVVPDLPAPVIEIEDAAPGVLVFEWEAIPNATSYEVNVNNMGWFPPNNGALSHFVNGLDEGDSVNIQVRGITDIGSCIREIAVVEVIYGECFMMVQPNILRQISCFGAEDGVIAANTQNAVPPVTFTLDESIQQNVSVFDNVGPGIHKILVEDSDGCIDSVFFDLVEPAEITLDPSATDVTCQGGSDGSLFAAASGGVGGFSYLWTTVPTTFDSIAVNQGPGNYTIQATDANGCRASDMTTIGEPDPIEIFLLGDEPSCNGGMDGSIIATITGGTMPYAYEWSNMQFTKDIMVGAGEYILTVRDANGCMAMRSIQITEPAPATATATSTDASCHNTEDGTATIDLVGAGPYGFAWDDTAMQNTQRATGLSPGIYNFTLTDVNGCNSVGFIGIGAPPEVTASTSSSRTSCFGGSDGTANVTVAGGVTPYSFLWNDAASQTTQVATGLTAGDYEVIITDGRMCTATRSVTVSSATEIMTVVDSTFASCLENADGSVSVFPVGGTGTYTYLWNDDNNQTTSLADDLSVGVYTVTVTDTNMCSVTDMVEVIAGDPVRIDSIVATMPSCFGESDGSLVGFISGGEATYTYRWNDPNAQFLNPANTLVAGSYTLTVTDVNGCTDTKDVILNEPDLLEVELVPTQIDCFGADNGIITANARGGTFPYRYMLDGVAVNNNVIENLPVGEYTVVVTDINDCTAIEMIRITQPDAPLEIAVMQTDTSCFNANMNAAEVFVNGGTGPNYSYSWSETSLPNAAMVSGLMTDTFYVTVTDENLCTAIDTVIIEEYAEIIPNMITSRPSCFGFGDGFIAVNTIEGGAGQGLIENYNYAWEDNPTETSHIRNNVFGGQYYTVTVTDNEGCTGIGRDSVGQPPQISFDIDKSNPSCFGFTDGFIEVTNINVVVDTYEWSTSPDDQGTRIENLGEGNYLVTVTDVDGCSVVTSVNLNEPDELLGSLTVTNNICSGDFDGVIVPEVIGGTVPYRYAWSNGSSTPFISNLPDGNYTVTITDDNDCSLILDTSLAAPAAIRVEADVVNITCFDGSDGSYTLNVSGGQGPYQFSFDGELFNSNNIRAGLSTGPYPVFVTDSQGCMWDSIIQIGTVPKFELFAGEDQFIPIGDSATLDVVLFNAVGIPEIIWSSPTDFDLSCDECNKTIVSPLFTATYEAYGIDDNGCEANDFVTVFIQKIAQIMVPTGFTPNGDNNNDRLIVHGKSKNIVQINSFSIYDRWGEMVYENKNFNINDETVGWDGTFRNEEMESGVYVWVLQVQFEDGTTDNFNGSTTLIR